MPASSLPVAPVSPVDPMGRPAVGAYAGHVARVAWGGLRGPYARGAIYRRLHYKTWHYVTLAGARCVVAFAVIDLGYAASAFAYVLDRRARRLLYDQSFTGLPRAARVADTAGPGARSRFAAAGAELELARPVGATEWTIRGRGPRGFAVDAIVDASAEPPTLCAIATIPDGVANCTHKTVCLPARGSVSVDGAHFDLAGSFAALDHTAGLLARETRWRWASASGAGVGFNLVEGFNGPVENGVWVAGRLLKVGAARFEFDPAATMKPWHVSTADGVLDVEFSPEGERREDKNLVVAASRYVQPIGTYRGTIRPPEGTAVDVDGLVGVTEDHVARW